MHYVGRLTPGCVPPQGVSVGQVNSVSFCLCVYHLHQQSGNFVSQSVVNSGSSCSSANGTICALRVNFVQNGTL